MPPPPPPLTSIFEGILKGALRSGITAAVVILGVTTVFMLGRLTYNIFFHPLSKYPGPKLWATSRLPWTYYSLQGEITHVIGRLHEQYGPVVRIAPDELSYNSGDAVWKTVYGHRSEEMQKPMDGRANLPSINKESTIFTADRADHQRFRRSISHAFSDKALREQEDYIQRYIDLLMVRLRERADAGPQNMVAWFNWTTFDIIGDLAFGAPFGCLENAHYHPWVSLMFKSIKYIPWGQVGVYYNIPWIMKYIVPKDIVEARIKTFSFAQTQVDARLADGSDRKDFIEYMAKQAGEKSLSSGEMHNMSGGLVVAGSETTATLLSGMTYYLLQSPSKYARLTAEIRSAFPTAADITMLKVDQLPYLQACLTEALRLFPPAPSTFPRTVPAAGETINGQYVPGGTSVGVNPLAAYHAERNFARAAEFHPERWLDASTWPARDTFARDCTDIFQPFSFGPRNCVGRNLAWAEMRLITAHLLWGFELQLADGMHGWPAQKIFLLWQKRPLMVSLRVRGDAAAAQ